MLSRLLLEIPFDVADIIEFGIMGFSLVLFALALSAYRNSGMKRILLAAGAFILFAIQFLVDYIEEYFNLLDEDSADIILSLITLGILLLFFTAIVKRK
jgi:hypothetical protein